MKTLTTILTLLITSALQAQTRFDSAFNANSKKIHDSGWVTMGVGTGVISLDSAWLSKNKITLSERYPPLVKTIDTIPATMLVTITEVGKEAPMRSFAMRGYVIRETDDYFITNTGYLNRYKQPLPKSIIVWQVKPVN